MERWKAIEEFGGLYQISDHGRVRSLKRRKELIMRQNLDNDGYSIVRFFISKNDKPTRKIHRLVALAFVPGRQDDLVVCHNDSNPSNNHYTNLRWDTLSANSLDRSAAGTCYHKRKTHCRIGHLLAEPNLVPAELKRGKRSCLACARARSVLKRIDHPDFNRVADDYFCRITNSL